MEGLIKSEFLAAGERERRPNAPTLGDRLRAADALISKLANRLFEVVAHEIEPSLSKRRRFTTPAKRVEGCLRRRKSKDEPALTRIH